MVLHSTRKCIYIHCKLYAELKLELPLNVFFSNKIISVQTCRSGCKTSTVYTPVLLFERELKEPSSLACQVGQDTVHIEQKIRKKGRKKQKQELITMPIIQFSLTFTEPGGYRKDS